MVPYDHYALKSLEVMYGVLHKHATENEAVEEGPTPDNASLTMRNAGQQDGIESKKDRYIENIVEGPTPDDVWLGAT